MMRIISVYGSESDHGMCWSAHQRKDVDIEGERQILTERECQFPRCPQHTGSLCIVEICFVIISGA